MKDGKTMVGFPEALTAVRGGKRIRRIDWDPEIHVAMMPGYKELKVNDVTLQVHGLLEGTTCTVPPYLSEYHLGVLSVWLPSMDDLFAEDWVIEEPWDGE